MAEILDTDTDVETNVETTTETAGNEPENATEGWITPDGQFSENAPEEVKSLLESKKWKSVNDLVKGYKELEKLTGSGKHLTIPEDDNPEAWEKVYDAIGRPESPDKYEIQYDGDVPIDDELVGQFKQYAYKLGLNQKQFNDTVAFQLDVVEAQLKAQEEERAAAAKLLKEKWGEANYENKILQSRKIADELGIYKTLEKKGLASDPDIIMMLDTIASKTSEDAIKDSDSEQTGQKSPEERLAEIKRSEAFTQRFHPDHKKIMAEYLAITQQLANEGKLTQPRL